MLPQKSSELSTIEHNIFMLPQKSNEVSWLEKRIHAHTFLFIYCKKSFPKQIEDHNSFCSANKGLSPNKDYYRLLIPHVRTSNHSLIKQYYVIHTIICIAKRQYGQSLFTQSHGEGEDMPHFLRTGTRKQQKKRKAPWEKENKKEHGNAKPSVPYLN